MVRSEPGPGQGMAGAGHTAARIREIRVLPNRPVHGAPQKILAQGCRGIVLFGGPCSVYDEGVPLPT